MGSNLRLSPSGPEIVGLAVGHILVWDGEKWLSEPPDGGVLPPGDNVGDMLRWTGAAWVPVPFPIPDGTNAGDILRWTGAEWVPLVFPIPDGNNAGDMLRWTGAAWAPVEFPIPDGNNAGDMLVWTGAVWAPAVVLVLPAGDEVGDMLRWTGAVWAPVEFPIPNGNNAGDMLVWTGAVWQPQVFPAAGGAQGNVYTWNGAAWVSAPLPRGGTKGWASTTLQTLGNTVLGAAVQLGSEAVFSPMVMGPTDNLEVSCSINFAFDSTASTNHLLLQVEIELDNDGNWYPLTQCRLNVGGPDDSAPTQMSASVSCIIPHAQLPVLVTGGGEIALRAMISGGGTIRMSNDADEMGGFNLWSKYLRA